MSALLTFRVFFRALSSRWSSSPPPKRPRAPPLVGFAALRPSAVRPSVCTLPEAEASFEPALPRANLVPPSWSLTTSTVCSTQGLRVCCTPLPAMGFDAFPGPASSSPEGVLDDLPVPRAAGHTLRRVPLISSRTASLRPLPSCLCCTLSLPGPARPKPSVAPSLQPRLPDRCQCAAAGRSRCQRVRRRRPKPLPTRVRPVEPKLSRLRATRRAEAFEVAVRRRRPKPLPTRFA